MCRLCFSLAVFSCVLSTSGTLGAQLKGQAPLSMLVKPFARNDGDITRAAAMVAPGILWASTTAGNTYEIDLVKAFGQRGGLCMRTQGVPRIFPLSGDADTEPSSHRSGVLFEPQGHIPAAVSILPNRRPYKLDSPSQKVRVAAPEAEKSGVSSIKNQAPFLIFFDPHRRGCGIVGNRPLITFPYSAQGNPAP